MTENAEKHRARQAETEDNAEIVPFIDALVDYLVLEGGKKPGSVLDGLDDFKHLGLEVLQHEHETAPILRERFENLFINKYWGDERRMLLRFLKTRDMAVRDEAGEELSRMIESEVRTLFSKK